MLRLLLVVGCCWLSSITFAQAHDHTVLPCPEPRGYALTDDFTGLVISAPQSTELIYFNTATEQEVKRVPLDFRPGSLCRQGQTLYVAAEGGALVFALELKSGKTIKQFEIEGDAVAALACHPEKGLIYATTGARLVFSIDPTTGKVTNTSAVGKYIGVTADGGSVIAGFQPSDKEYDYAVAEGKRIVIPWDGTWGARGQLLKYKVNGAGLDFETAQNCAASNAWSFALSPDGKSAAMPSGGGWRPEGGGGGYVTAVFSTSNLQTMQKQVPSSIGIAFHPVLDLIATSHDEGVKILAGKTLKPVAGFSLKGNGSSALLAVGAKGTKFVFYNGTEAGQGLHFLPLELKSEQRAALTKAYGTLPKPVEVAEVKNPAPVDAPKNPMKAKPAESASAQRPAAPPEVSVEPAPKVPVKPSKQLREVTAGFNDAKGMNADTKRSSPYPVGARGVTGGQTEGGWKGPWELKGEAKCVAFVNDVVYEGDGALYVSGGTAGVVRQFAASLKTPFEIEQYVRILDGGHLMCYVGEEENATGPMWFAQDGKFLALNGEGEQFGPNHAVDTGVAPDPDKWHKIVLKVYPAKHEYEFFVDDKQCGERYHFRHNTGTMNEVRYVTEREAGFLLDAITVRPLKDGK